MALPVGQPGITVSDMHGGMCMKKNGKKSLLARFAGRRRSGSPAGSAGHDGQIHASAVDAAAAIKLSGASLEQAYRDLLLENQVLVESNKRLHERVARLDAGVEDSPATRELIRAQRDALAERSHRLREIEYENKRLKRKQKKLFDDNKRLAASLARRMEDIQPLLRREESVRRELEEVREQLRQKKSDLLKLTDRYYQLEARLKPQLPPDSVANGDF